MKQPVILFFTKGSSPTEEEIEAANELGANVKFRAAKFVGDETHGLEICDGVAGQVPKTYAEKYPAAEEALASKKLKFKELSEKAGDEQAPKASENKPVEQWGAKANKG